MLIAVLLVALLLASVGLSRLTRRSARVNVASCCAARPWPPDDLTDPARGER